MQLITMECTVCITCSPNTLEIHVNQQIVISEFLATERRQ